MKFVTLSARTLAAVSAVLFLFSTAKMDLVTTAGAVEDGSALASNAQDLSGVWWTKSYSAKIDPGGTVVVFTPDGQARYDGNLAGLRDGSIVDTARTNCTSDGVPRIMAAPYPFEISQTSDRITIRIEAYNTIRTVIMGDSVPPEDELTPTELGHSFGRWEDDTLIVETTGFTDNTFLDATGLPHSDQLHVTEYFWKSNDGGLLHYVALVLDPAIFTQAWAQRLSYERRPDIHIGDYVCGGNNRDISQVVGAEAWR